MADCQHTCRTCEAWSDIESIRLRLEARTDRADPSGCWIWTGTKNAKGYGQLGVGSQPEYAHRIAVRLDGRSLPEGMQVDHLCRNPSCVNPQHLEVVTAAKNMRRRNLQSRLTPQNHQPGASGVRGVTWHKGKRKWRAKVAGKQIGEFADLDEASRAVGIVAPSRGLSPTEPTKATGRTY